MHFKSLLALAALPALFAATPASAAKRDFETCDGLRAPGGGETGMAGEVSSSGIFPGGLALSAETAPALVAACTSALADPRLLPAQALRRSHLLRARAIAQLQAGNPDAALADVDAAVAAAGPLNADPLFARSMGGSFELIRAAGDVAKDDRVRARALIEQAAARRPYSSSVQSVAAMIRQRARDSGQPAPAAMLPLLPLLPNAVALQFNSDIEAGRFAQAAALWPRIDKPAAIVAGQPLYNAELVIQPIILASGAAYAFAATGQPAKAKAVMTAAAAQLAAALAPATAAAAGKSAPMAAMLLNQYATPLRTYLARNTALVDARIAVAEARPLDALKLLVGTELPISASSVELLTALRDALPAANRALAPDPALLADRLAAQRKAEKLDVAALKRGMAAPETSRSLADYKQSSSGFLQSFFGGSGSATDGFKAKTDEKTGVVTVSFVGNATSAPVVEEMTLLRAAELARQAGKPGLIIVARRDYQRTLTMTRGYSAIPISSTPAGYKTELDVRFVDPAALPADLAGERDRVLDAARVYAALAPIYVPPAVGPRK